MATPGELVPASVPSAERVRIAWQRRSETDYRFEKPWLNVVLMLITCGIFGYYLFYQLVKRDRSHDENHHCRAVGHQLIVTQHHRRRVAFEA